MNMLKITNLDAFYGESHVLHGIDLAVEAGEVVTLIGRNGAGKTTTLKSIIGDVPRRTGSILFNGVEIINTSSERICKMSVGFVPDDRGISTLSVDQNLTIGRPAGQYAWPLEPLTHLFPALRERRDTEGLLAFGRRAANAGNRATSLHGRIISAA